MLRAALAAHFVPGELVVGEVVVVPIEVAGLIDGAVFVLVAGDNVRQGARGDRLGDALDRGAGWPAGATNSAIRA